MIALERVPHEETERYGIVDARLYSDNVYQINDLVEKPSKDKAPSDLAIIGRYILSPTIFAHIRNIDRGEGGISTYRCIKKFREKNHCGE